MSGVQRPTFSVVEFTSLPQNLRTKQIRKKFDKDGSGFLEAKNAQGQNEIYMLEQAMGLDLSKYKTATSKVETNTRDTGNIDYQPYKVSTLYGPNGKPSVVLYSQVKRNFIDSEFISREEINGNKSTTQTYIGSNLKLDKESPTETVTKNVSYGNKKGLTKTEIKDIDYTEVSYVDKNGHVVACFQEIAGKNMDYTKNPYNQESETLFNDNKYGILTKHTENTGKGDAVHYTLNGEKAEVKKSKNGRYEITQKEKTNVYSHDGKKLKMSYVMADTIKLENGYQKKVSPNGKETWYYAPNGKAISQAQYHVSVAKNIKVRNGKFIYNNQELPAKLNKNGSYTVNVGGENIVLNKIKKH